MACGLYPFDVTFVVFVAGQSGVVSSLWCDYPHVTIVSKGLSDSLFTYASGVIKSILEYSLETDK
jgi:hypothetical protein